MLKYFVDSGIIETLTKKDKELFMTNGKILGLDIGIASVGVGIINAKTGNVEFFQQLMPIIMWKDVARVEGAA